MLANISAYSTTPRSSPDLRQEVGHVIGDFAHAGLDLERRVPGAARGVEPVRLARLGIGEGGVDERRVGNPVDELVPADAFRPALLGDEAGAGRALDFRQRLDLIGRRRAPAAPARRRRAVETSRTVRGNASRTIAQAFGIQAGLTDRRARRRS